LEDLTRARLAQRPGLGPRREADRHQPDEPAERDVRRQCPWCDSFNTRFVQRGFTGPTDERDQYFTCNDCGRLTYEIVSRTVRDMRLGQFRAGGLFRDSARQTKYTISRVLKVGMNEFLLYVKPVLGRRDADARR
jgi:transposase-like protein